MQRLYSLGGEHFQMEDGAYLVVPRTRADARQVEASATDGDLVFSLARRAGTLVGLLRPAAEGGLAEKTIRDTAGVIAFQLRKRRLAFDDKQEGSYRLLFRVPPAALDVSVSVKPASKRYVQTRSFRPSARRSVAQALIEEIITPLRDGNVQGALEKTEQVHALLPRYRTMIAKGVLEAFAQLGTQIAEDERFYLPRFLAAHKAFQSVLDELRPFLDPGAMPAPRGRALLASIKGDYGQGKEIVADVLIATGHRVSDLGCNLGPEAIVQAVSEGARAVLVITALVPISLRLAADVFRHGRTCRQAVKELMASLEQRDLRGRVEVILVGFAFNSRFAREAGADRMCRTLGSLFQEFYERTARGRRE